jgi:hypothetical protein
MTQASLTDKQSDQVDALGAQLVVAREIAGQMLGGAR